jgi:hypothetical protein
MNSPSLKISVGYLASEKRKGNHVWKWIASYCRRNKIQFFLNLEEEQFQIYFKSENQKICFVRNGNRTFPYFEFW